ncbi:hypothetical protein [Flavobacterium selenitireducens]|uniref:hypothetical protein n=1 Tax=Flavobacterium selenitireducens TaxID=2722704 RepID=UPI00168A7B22|nr:hypothetical protein [Flavobacterium selenitireducens]MBD3581289.1 hypothetical protein [Flavobacterium selenitireducens]
MAKATLTIEEHESKPNPRIVFLESETDEIFIEAEIGNGDAGGHQLFDGTKKIHSGALMPKISLGLAGALQDKTYKVVHNVVKLMGPRAIVTTKFTNQDGVQLNEDTEDKGKYSSDGFARFKGEYLFKLKMLLCLLGVTSALWAQGTVELKDLETPASPGLILLDKTPESIAKPSTPQGVSASLLGMLSNGGGALEFAPYWLFDHPKLTAKKILENNQDYVWRHISVSGATLKGNDTTRVSAGLRARLFEHRNKDSIATATDLLKTINSLAAEDLDGNSEKIAELRTRYLNILEHPIFSIDFAAAITGITNNQSFDDVLLSRWGVWVNFNRYVSEKNSFTGMIRYLGNEILDGYQESVKLGDVGVRYNYEVEKFTLGLEYIQRFNLTVDSKPDFRLAAIGKYKIFDNVFLSATFGKNFSEVNNIIALGGLNFGFATSAVKK